MIFTEFKNSTFYRYRRLPCPRDRVRSWWWRRCLAAAWRRTCPRRTAGTPLSAICRPRNRRHLLQRDCTGCLQPWGSKCIIDIQGKPLYFFNKNLICKYLSWVFSIYWTPREKCDSPKPAHVEQELDGHEDWVVEVNLINTKSRGQSDQNESFCCISIDQ